MTATSSFHLSTTLVVLRGQGAAMEILLAGKNANDIAQLPEILASRGVHPKAQAAAWLRKKGLPFSPAELDLLSLHGFSQPEAKLTQGVMLWSPKPRTSVEGSQWVPLGLISQFQGVSGALVCEALAHFWQQMPTANVRLAQVRPYAEGPDASGPAIFFGGSFHPWHRAHQACIELCPRPERVIVVPDNNPQKTHQKRLCAWRTYRQLVEIATPLGAFVFPGFCGLEYANPTVGWLPQTRYDQRHYLMGDDSLATLPRWIEAESLARALDHLWIAPRRSKAADIAQAVEWLGQVAPQCNITFLGDHAFRDVSSSAIRARSKD